MDLRRPAMRESDEMGDIGIFTRLMWSRQVFKDGRPVMNGVFTDNDRAVDGCCIYEKSSYLNPGYLIIGPRVDHSAWCDLYPGDVMILVPSELFSGMIEHPERHPQITRTNGGYYVNGIPVPYSSWLMVPPCSPDIMVEISKQRVSSNRA